MAKRKGRRKPGTGQAKPERNGTWTARYPRVGGGYHVRRGFSTRPAAEAWLNSLVTQQAERYDITRGQQRVDAWVDTWIERAAKDRQWKAKMLADVLYKLGYIKPYLGGYALADVLPDHVDLMFDELARDLAENTIRQIRNYLYQVFEAAVKRRYITFNPVIKPERRKRVKQQEPQRLTVAQTIRVLHEAGESFYALAWWLIFTLGLRAGEACGLRWGDIDLEHATLTITQEVTDLRGVPHKDKPKGDKIRTLPIPRGMIPLFVAHERAHTRRAAQGVQKGYWEHNGLVFPGRGGRPMNPTSLRHQLQRLTDACKLPPIKAHEARHTAAKFYTDLGCPQEISGPILGHGPRTITGHYAPPDVEVMRPWVEKVYARLAGEGESKRVQKEA